MAEDYKDPTEDEDVRKKEGGFTFADPGEPGVEEQGRSTMDAHAGEEAQAAPVTQEALPPEAQGEVNGGPLGCCLGVAIGLMVSLSIAVIGRLYANDLLPVLHSPVLVLILLRVAMGIVALAAAIVCGYFGWKIGKRLYREYEAPVIKYRGYKKSKTKEVRNNL
jgi:hypothetical protein